MNNRKYYNMGSLVRHNKTMAREGIGIQKVTSDETQTDEEYQQFLKKYNKLTEEM